MAAGTDRDFEALVRTHQAAVCATAYSVLRDRARAEEVAQDAFLLAWQKLPALVESGAPPAMPGWICGIARNLARNAARKKREIAMEEDRGSVTSEEGPLDSLLSKESRAIADGALASLDERDREAITVYYMGEGHADVARALGITEANARQRVHRARTKLRDAATAVEATLRAVRPGPAFTGACVAALAAGKTIDANAARATPKPFVGTTGMAAALVGATAAVVAVVVAVTSASPPSPRPTVGSANAPVASQHAAADAADGVAIDRAAILQRLTPEKRDELVARLNTVGAAIAASPTAVVADSDKTKVYDFSGGPLEGGKPIDPPPPDASPKRLLRYAIQEIQPLLVECHRGLPSSGTLAMRVVLVGAPGIGTIVESVDIDDNDDGSSAVFEPSFTECMRETLYAIELPPMATADRWDVRYPFGVTPSP